MKNNLLHSLLSLLLLLGLCGPARATTPPAPTSRPLAEALNTDGTLKTGLNGSFDARAFRMRTAPDGRPVFRPAGTQGAGDERWQDGFWLSGTNTEVATVVRAGTDIYIGGSFWVVNNIVANGVAKWNGTVWSSLGTGAANGVNGSVGALAFASNGDMYAGGTFDTAGGVVANNVARWNGTAWSALGAGVSGPNNGSVRALAIATNGDVYVGGDFATAGGAPAKNVARWNGTAWSSLGAGTTGLNPGDTFVSALAIANNGDVYAGGTFDTAGSVAASNVARWNGTAWSSLGTGTQNGVTSSANVWITRLTIASNGIVYAGGFFNRAGGAPANGVAKWNGTAWSGLGAGPGTGNLFVADDLEIASNGDVYAAGWFSTPSGILTSSAVAKWNGTAWTILGTGTIGTSAYSFFTGLTLAANGDVYVSGSFAHINGVAASNVARWNGTAWSRLGTGMANGIEGDNGCYVKAVAIAGNGDVYAAGSFSVAGGVPANNVARWNGTAWNSLGTGAANGVNSIVSALAVASNGDVYVGGYFSQAGGVAVNSVARWNGTVWSSVGSGLVTSGYRNLATVNALAVASNGNVYAGGTFDTAGSVAANNVAIWNGTAWSSLGTAPANGVNRSVGALAVASTGDVYVGGDFGIARWNGTAWSNLSTGAGNISASRVWAIALASNGDIYANGNFTGTGAPAYGVARWNGTAWSSLGAGPAVANSSVRQLALASNGDVYAGLGISSPGTNIIGSSAVSKWDGISWTSVGGTGLNYFISCLAVGPTGKLYVGGAFSATGDGSKVMVRFGIYDPNAPLAAAAPAAPAAQLFPNPAHGTTTLRLPAGAPRLPVNLTDALGRTVRRYAAPATAEAELDLRGLPAGTYVVRCGAYSQRLVVE